MTALDAAEEYVRWADDSVYVPSRADLPAQAKFGNAVVVGAERAIYYFDGVEWRKVGDSLPPSFTDSFATDGALGDGWITGHDVQPSRWEPFEVVSGAVRLASNMSRADTSRYQGQGVNLSPAPNGLIYPSISTAWRETGADDVSVSVTWSGLSADPNHVEASPLVAINTESPLFGFGCWPSYVSGSPTLFIGYVGAPAEKPTVVAASPLTHTSGTPRVITVKVIDHEATCFVDGVQVDASIAVNDGPTYGTDPIPLDESLRGSTLHGFAADLHTVVGDPTDLDIITDFSYTALSGQPADVAAGQLLELKAPSSITAVGNLSSLEYKRLSDLTSSAFVMPKRGVRVSLSGLNCSAASGGTVLGSAIVYRVLPDGAWPTSGLSAPTAVKGALPSTSSSTAAKIPPLTAFITPDMVDPGDVIQVSAFIGSVGGTASTVTVDAATALFAPTLEVSYL